MSIDDTSPVPEPLAETGQDSAQTTDTALQPTDTVGAVSVHPDQEISPDSQQGSSSLITGGSHTLNSIMNIGGGGSMVANNLDNVGVINVQQDGALEVYDLNNFGIINVQQGGALEVHNLDNFGIINAQDGASLVFHDPHDLGIINAPQITFTTVSSLHGKDDASGVTPSEVESLHAELKNMDDDGVLTDLGQVTLSVSVPDLSVSVPDNGMEWFFSYASSNIDYDYSEWSDYTITMSPEGEEDATLLEISTSDLENAGIEKLDTSLATLDLDKVPMDEDFPETELAGQPNSTTGSLAGGVPLGHKL